MRNTLALIYITRRDKFGRPNGHQFSSKIRPVNNINKKRRADKQIGRLSQGTWAETTITYLTIIK